VTFAGFPREAFQFFEAVAGDTSQEVVDANRELHARAIRVPMLGLMAELEDEFGPAHVYNLHRDPDLWMHQHAYVSAADTIVYGAVLSLDGLAVEGGWLYSGADQVARYRDAVAARGDELARIVGRLEERGFEIFGERLATRPRGIPPDHPNVELLRHRSLVASRDLGRGDWLHGREAVARVRDGWQALSPLVDWFAREVGPRDGRALQEARPA
jgi:uncharacterized protein (DUF2461 family)